MESEKQGVVITHWAGTTLVELSTLFETDELVYYFGKALPILTRFIA